ncbi:MAG TPA: hypothetical protein VFN06_02640 [Gaiellaceae bacterium]|nr:hypothetical protein [Gaiellaceae bacterium]
MERKTMKRPSAALVVAMIALFVALGGTAGAVVTAAVPLAKRALVADNAKKLNGVTASQLGSAAVAVALRESPAGARPASTAGGLLSIKTTTATLAANGEGEFTVTCDAGQRAAGGGFSSDGAVFNFDSYPVSTSAWRLYLANADEANAANVTLYATCLR